MVDHQSVPASLDYAAPRIFLDGRFCFRSGTGVLGCILPTAVGALFAWVAYYAPGPFDALVLGMRVLFGLAGLGLIGFGGYFVWGLIFNRTNIIQITEDGLVEEGRLLAWENIARVEGVIYANGVSMHFWEGGKKFQTIRNVQFTPAMTKKLYEALARVLIDQVVPFHPHVEINPHAYVDNSG